MKKVIVIGNGMVGYKFCEKLRAKAGHQEVSLLVYGEESVPAYDRVHLSEYFTNQSEEKLLMAPAGWYAENDISLKTSQLVTEIDRDQKIVRTHTGETEAYDYLILATDSRPMVPPIKGVDKKGVFVYRTIEDLDQIIAYAKNVKRGAVLGGGLLGLEAAKALMDLKLDAQVVEFASRLMPRQLDEAGSNMLKSKIESLGIEILLNKSTSEIQGNGKLDGLLFADGSQLDTDMLVISCGIVSRDELAAQAGLETGKRGGFKVNNQLQTNDPHIYAIGEAVSYNDMVYGLVAPGYDMADTVVDQILGSGQKQFTGADMSTKLKLIGVEVGVLETPWVISPGVSPSFSKTKTPASTSESTSHRIVKNYWVASWWATPVPMACCSRSPKMAWRSPNPEDLILGARGGESGGNSMMDLPDTAQICSCENVTKGDIVGAIKDQELTDLQQVRTCTKAGTGCGACSPMVGDIFTATLKSMGQVVRKTICAHFDYTRQELFSLIKVKGIQSFDELLDQYGSGDGCETCKLAVASLMASIWNDLILKQDTIQDTNDRFLANIQKEVATLWCLA